MGAFDALFVPALDGIAYGLLLFVVAAGLTLAFGTGNLLNLAHGVLYAGGAYLAAVLGDGSWSQLALAVLAGLALGAGGGLLLSLLLAPVADRGHLTQALLTVGIALIGANLLVAVFGSDELPVTVPAGLEQTVSVAGHRYPAYRLAFVGVALALALVGWLVLAKSRLGALVRATTDDAEMVACSGVNPRLVRGGVLAVAGALAGLAGALGAPILGPGPRVADTVLLLSLVVVVLGGLGSVPGAFLAAIAVGQVQSLGVVLLPDWAPYLLFAALALALVFRAPGLRLLAGRA